MRLITTFLMVIVVLVFSTTTAFSAKQEETKGFGQEAFSKYVGANGTIRLPEGYRASWTHMGSWVVPDETAPGYGFHDVYTQPEALAAFRKTGQFPDGAILVKEIRKVQTDQLTTGKASWAGDVNMWFVMIKDTQGRFSESSNWGEGWGWALFKAENPARNASTDFNKDCIPCHIPAKENDWVYLKGYPTLK